MTHPARFAWADLLSADDFTLACDIIGGARAPDLVIAPDGKPYIYRFHLVRQHQASIYFHIQCASDPHRPLHDHPWDCTSTILAGGYDETYAMPHKKGNTQFEGTHFTRKMRAGDTVFRKAEEAHRIVLPPGIPYAMSLFSMGVRRRDWGFYFPDGWKSHAEVIRDENGVSVFINPENANE
jgi:hypothetical protein